MRVMPQLRAMFSSLGLDVTSCSDDALVEAMLRVCPVVDDRWPSDEQMRCVFAILSR